MIKRAAYLGSSVVCGVASYVCLGLSIEYKQPVPVLGFAGFGLASLEMGKKAFKRKKKCNCNCENCKC